MVTRFFFISGLALMGITAYFIVIERPPTIQEPPATSEVTKLQAKGILPSGDIAENDEIEHGVFDVPEMDEMMLEVAIADMGNMPGMNMGSMPGMDMSNGETMDMAGTQSGTMDMGNGETMDMAGSQSGTMDMGNGETMDMTGAQSGMMDMGNGETMDMASTQSGTMDMGNGETMDMAGSQSGTMDMGNGETMDMALAECEGDGGLQFCDKDQPADREITLSMREWSFDQLNIEVKAGERIRFNVRNDGKVLHEFMFMTMPLMQAVTYRAKRADWSLLEHEALFEKSLMLPGQELSFVVEIQESGSWMFMCMLPYHMQMGMMGQIATPGAAMDM